MLIRKVREFYKAAAKKSLPNVELSSDTWRRRWDSPAPLQQSAGLLQPGGTQSAGHGLFSSHQQLHYTVQKENRQRFSSP